MKFIPPGSAKRSIKMPSSADKSLVRMPLLDRVQPRVPGRRRFDVAPPTIRGLFETSDRILEKHRRFIARLLFKGIGTSRRYERVVARDPRVRRGGAPGYMPTSLAIIDRAIRPPAAAAFPRYQGMSPPVSDAPERPRVNNS